mmetsp:Transcript_13670/g.39941  ORF Transcript_13670/g.39941 Transcript_13670/m.39941 type:complete len:215 (-) Transcript_13670:136-780(-)
MGKGGHGHATISLAGAVLIEECSRTQSVLQVSVLYLRRAQRTELSRRRSSQSHRSPGKSILIEGPSERVHRTEQSDCLRRRRALEVDGVGHVARGAITCWFRRSRGLTATPAAMGGRGGRRRWTARIPSKHRGRRPLARAHPGVRRQHGLVRRRSGAGGSHDGRRMRLRRVRATITAAGPASTVEAMMVGPVRMATVLPGPGVVLIDLGSVQFF